MANSARGCLRPLFANYLWSQFIEAATEVRDIVKRFFGDGLSHRPGLSAVPTKNDNARVVVLQGNDLEKAVIYSHRAGVKAASHCAYREAVLYFEQALGHWQKQ